MANECNRDVSPIMHAVVPKASLDYHFAPMHIEYLAKAYEAKTDEELLQLAGEANDLTPDAFTALRSEMARRRIDAPDLVPDASKAGAIRQSPGAFPGVEATSVAEFVAEAIGVYHRRFWLFLMLVAPAAAIGWFAIVTGRHESTEIARHIPRGIEGNRHFIEIVEIGLANLAGLFGSWIAFSFSFAAISVAVQKLATGFVPSIAECFISVRNRLGPFLRLSSLLFAFLLIAEGAAILLLQFGILWVLWRLPIHVTPSIISLIFFACFGLGLVVISRFSLAIPALILDNCKVGESVFRSDEYTEGKWLVLTALVAKSVVGGYVAAMVPFWTASSILGNMLVPWWFNWALTAASIAAASVVEPTMFIGFTLLYLQRSKVSSTSSAALSATIS